MTQAKPETEMDRPTAPRVLFVCLGNICRSPLAEGFFLHEAKLAGLAAEADSAGTRDWHEGNPPDKRSIKVASQHGVSISAQRARPLVGKDFERFTHIIGMDRTNLEAITAMAPVHHQAELGLLLDYADGLAGQDILDPWHGRAEAFEQCRDEVILGVRGLVRHLLLNARQP